MTEEKLTMRVDQIFAPLKDELSKRCYSAADLFDMIGSGVDDNPQISRAMAFHARDILATMPAMDSTAVLIEVYRRTFFDRYYSEVYGTDQLFDEGPAALEGLVAHMVSNLRMDDAASGEVSNILQ